MFDTGIGNLEGEFVIARDPPLRRNRASRRNFWSVVDQIGCCILRVDTRTRQHNCQDAAAISQLHRPGASGWRGRTVV
jgi:hypothetical protein